MPPLPHRVASVLAVAMIATACGRGATVTSGPTESAGGSPVATSPVPPSGTAPATALPSAIGGLRAVRHIFTIVMENEDASAVLGNAAAPYLDGLAHRFALAASYSAVAHPSEPNYIAMFSGSTQGITDDGVHDITGVPTVADQIEATGRTWKVAAQNVPGGCFTGSTASGGPDGPGTYARKHEPAISFTSISGDPKRCSSIVDFAHFDPNAADYWFIVPNLCNDMHDCGVAAGDRFLASFVPRILASDAFTDGVLFLTFDEGRTTPGKSASSVLMIAASPFARPGFVSSTPFDHYSYVRTIEDAWSMPCLALACGAKPMTELFQ